MKHLTFSQAMHLMNKSRSVLEWNLYRDMIKEQVTLEILGIIDGSGFITRILRRNNGGILPEDTGYLRPLSRRSA